MQSPATLEASRAYQQCARCVMDTTAADIVFGEDGYCNYCTDFIRRSCRVLFHGTTELSAGLGHLVSTIKENGKGKRYDCIVGVSGGVDSSWVLVEAVRAGLRPLAVHMDNGWNSELAQNNISNLVRKLGVDLYTHVIDWEEYRALMQAFFDADVIDVELLYDNAMLAVNFEMAAKYRLSYILAGTNQATEGLSIPRNWNWFKLDKRNIFGLSRRFGGPRLRTFPSIGVLKNIYYNRVLKIKWTPFLDYLKYNKFESLDVLGRDFEYKRYPYKHYESIFTRFYQGYILPRKFGVDKRRVHFSALIVSGQMTRAAALADLKGPAYPSDRALDEDIDYFLKKMRWSSADLESYLARPEIPHDAYPSEKALNDFVVKVGKSLPSALKRILKSPE